MVGSETTADSDAQLYEAWGRGDRSAGEVLIARYYDALERFFATKAATVDDLIQETLLTCAESATRFRGEGTFRSFLYGVARNVLREHIRRRVRDGSAPDFGASSIIDLQPGVATVASQRDEQRQLVFALQRLPVDLQMLLELYYWEELSVDELGVALDIPAGTVKSRLHRARDLLRETMNVLPPSDDAGDRRLLEQWIAGIRG